MNLEISFLSGALRKRISLALSLLLPVMVQAGDPGRVIVELLWMNAGEVDFGGIGYLDPLQDPGPVSGLADRFYDNGYVRIDNSGNSEGMTWYWGLQDDQGVAPESINMYSYRSAGDKEMRMDGDPDAPVIGLRYMKPLLQKESTDLQLLLGLRVGQFDFGDNTVLTGAASALVDSYFTGGILLPTVPYYGSAEGPGPLIDSEPFRRRVELSSLESRTVGSRRLSGDLLAFRLGLAMEREVSEKMDLSVLLGYELLRVEGTLAYEESTTISGTDHSGSYSGSRSEHLTDGGVFINANLTRDLTERLTLELTLGLSDHDSFEISDGRHQVSWDLSGIFEMGVGVGYRF